MLERSDYIDPAAAPFGKREVKLASPNISDLTVIEVVPISPENYEALPYGSPHPDYTNNGLILVWQGPVKAANNQIKVLRVYATRGGDEDWYNYALHYGGDLAAVPIFIRSYIMLRTDFEEKARGLPFSGLYQALLTDQGAGYDAKPTIAVTGGGGSGASLEAIMNETGDKVIGIRIVAEGTGYTSTPTIGFSGGTPSTPAAATAVIQPTDALLVKEETAKLDSEDPQLASLFIKVNRVYETLPGAALIWDTYHDERGPVQRSSQPILAVGNEVASFTRPVSGLARKTWFEPRGDSAIVLNKIIEDWTEVVVDDQEVTSEFGGGVLNVTERRAAPGAQTPDSGLRVISSVTDTTSPAEQTKKSKILVDSEWPELVEEKVITEGLFSGVRIEVRKKYVAVSTTNPNPNPFASNPPTFAEFQAYDKWRKRQLISKILFYPTTALVYFDNEEVHLPSKLISAEHDWTIASHDGGSSHVSLDDTVAESGADGGTEVIPVIKILADAGYRGPVLARITRTFFLMTTEGVGPGAGIVDSPEKIIPSNGVAILTGRRVVGNSTVGNVTNSLAVEGRISREIREFGPFLTGGVAVSDTHAVSAAGPGSFDNTAAATAGPKTGTFNAALLAIAADASVEITAPASTPTELTSGTFYIWRVRVIPGPLGLFAIEKTEIKAP